MDRKQFIEAVQRRVAVVAIGASTVRGQGAMGVVAAARSFLSDLPLRDFSASREKKFNLALERATLALAKALPKAAASWGLARKCLNIFLRDAFYNAYLAPYYRLEKSELWYEVPLDGLVAKALMKEDKAGELPRWAGVKHLQRGVSETYQAFALARSRRMKISRVHLDTFLWS